MEVNIPDFTGKGVPDPAVGLACFRGAIGREPTAEEMSALMMLRQRYLAEEVETSPGYRVMPGVPELLERLSGGGPPGRADHRQHRARRAHQARPRRPQPLLRLRRLRLGRRRARRRLPQGARPSRRVAGEGFDRAGSIAIGDTPLDVEAGHGAGIRVTAVATGEYGVEELRAAGADWTVETLESDQLPF